MERRDQDVLALGSHDSPVYLAQYLDSGSHILEEWRSDEHPQERFLETLYLELLLEGVHLAPKPVPLDQSVHQPQERLPRSRGRRRRQNHPRARSPNGTALVEKAPDAVQKVRLRHHLSDRGRLAAGHDEPVQTLQIRHVSDLDGFGAELF